MSEDNAAQDKYVPPKVWVNVSSGGTFASINQPTAGVRTETKLPVGEHPIQLYSMGTPNGIKVTVMLEELNDACGVEYDAWMISILNGDQFGSDFVGINPNSKIPAMTDRSDPAKPIRLFESASMMVHLAEKYGKFLPTDPAGKAECMNWVFWQMGSAPYLGGGFGHFYAYAPEKFEYPINRFAMEAKRQLSVLDLHLGGADRDGKPRKFIMDDEYTIADMIIWPWYGVLAQGGLYDAAEFLDTKSYTHVMRWAEEIAARPAVKRGRIVNRTWGAEGDQLKERHSKADFEGKNC
jgi:GST-like protein